MAGKPRFSGAPTALEALGVASAVWRAAAYAERKQTHLLELIALKDFHVFGDGLQSVSALVALGWPLAVASSSKNANGMLRLVPYDRGRSLVDTFTNRSQSGVAMKVGNTSMSTLTKSSQIGSFAAIERRLKEHQGFCRRIDTHMSHLFLGDHQVLKLMRAIRHPFADMSTLAARKAACDAELVVNTMLAPTLYECVETVVRTTAGDYVLGGEGEIVDYVVRMKRFKDGALFSDFAAKGSLTADLVLAAVEILAAFHVRQPACRDAEAASDYHDVIEGLRLTALRSAGLLCLDVLAQDTFDQLESRLGSLAPLLETRQVLERLNSRVMRRLGTSRSDLFESIERPALRPLPDTDWQFAAWRVVRVGLDYHVEVDGFYYSVPHALIRAEVDTRLTERTLEVFHRGNRVAAHQRRYGGRRHGTDPEHMPSAHRRYAEWSPDRFKRWAKAIGPTTEALIIAVLANRPHPEQGFRTCLGILRLYRGIETARAERVSATALDIGAFTYRSVASILANNIKPTPARKEAEPVSLFDHQNIRGAGYFN